MAEDIKQEMNSTPGCIPSKWNRNTVADGDWLQKYTLAPLSSRDNFLADKISGTEFNLDEEIRERKAGDAYLSGAIESVSSDFYTFSGNVCVSAENLSAALKEEIRIRGEQDYNLSQQIIGEKTQRIEADNKLQKEIDKLEAATDVIMVYADYNEFTIGSAYLVEEDYLTDADVIKVLQDETSGSKQIYYQWYDPASAHEWSGWSAIGSLEPYYSIADMDRILADTVDNLSATVSSNYLSANGTAVQSGHNIVISAHPTSPYIKIETSSHVTFDGVSSTNLSATNASGTSAVYSNISSTNLTALTANGNSAKFTNISATNLNADNVTFGTANFDDIIAKNISASEKLSAKSATIISSNITNLSSTNISATNLTALTASGDTSKYINFSGTNISGASKTATIDNLIGSAQNGKDAYDKVSTAYWSAYKDSTHSGSGKLSGSFSISAGENIGLDVVGNTIKISGTPAGITSISSYSPAKLYTDGMVTFSAGNEITFTTASDKLGINASTNLINSAHDGSAAYNILTTQSATITNGPGILFYNDDNKLGIKVDVRGVSNTITGIGISALSAGDNYRQGKNIEITGTDIKDISLSSRIDVPDGVITSASNKLVEINPNHAIVSANTTRTEYVDITPQNIHINTYGQPGSDAYLFSDCFSAIVPDPQTHQHSLTGTISWYNLTQIPYNYMKVNTAASGSILSANTAVTLVVTAQLPGNLNDNTYYIV